MNKFYLSNRDPYAYIQLIIGLFVFPAGSSSCLRLIWEWLRGVCFMGDHEQFSVNAGKSISDRRTYCNPLFTFFKIYPGIGTLFNMIVIGFFIDLINPHVPSMHNHFSQIAMLALGIILIGIGSGLYINANLGAGPRDGLMLGLSKKTGKSIRLIRNSMEIMILVTGFFLGGPVGVGTVAFALAIGPSVQFFKLIPEKGSGNLKK